MATSLRSKSELALNRSVDGTSLTLMGYRGGPGCPTLTLDPTSNIPTQGTNVGPVSPTEPNIGMAFFVFDDKAHGNSRELSSVRKTR